MYNNLRAEMARRGLTSKDLALMIEMPFTTFYKKFQGKTEFTVSETKKIIFALGPDENGEMFTVEHLFFING